VIVGPHGSAFNKEICERDAEAWSEATYGLGTLALKVLKKKHPDARIVEFDFEYLAIVYEYG